MVLLFSRLIWKNGTFEFEQPAGSQIVHPLVEFAKLEEKWERARQIRDQENLYWFNQLNQQQKELYTNYQEAKEHADTRFELWRQNALEAKLAHMTLMGNVKNPRWAKLEATYHVAAIKSFAAMVQYDGAKDKAREAHRLFTFGYLGTKENPIIVLEEEEE
ncbi:hypothetical protein G9A89_018557 [Geosiphon pyriformis]|nr:hypothetical protein G9A89_018557 [Geosiphon pyriformis]